MHKIFPAQPATQKSFLKTLAFILAFAAAWRPAFAVPQPTPVNVHIQRSPLDKLNIRLREHNIQIERETRLGKLTKVQAKSLKAQVEAIRKAEIANLKQNGTKTLTDTQLASLNGQLNTLSKSIPVK
ncbi:MAG TPA: hypothetical protein VK859_07480 [bacterium]|nr:hypothetical protein [bacterium]